MKKVEWTHTDKVWFPKEGITKGDILKYFSKIASKMLPHMKRRPLVMERFPDGIKQEGFFQKNVPEYFPDWIPSVRVKREGGHGEIVVCSSKEVLLFLVNFGCLTPHLWLSSGKHIERPDRLIFDIDPPKGKIDEAREVVRCLKKVLEKEYGLKPFLMTTGSRGFHVVVPIKPTVDFDQGRAFAKQVAGRVVGLLPKICTTAVRKGSRKGMVYLDVMRNAYAQHAVAPYAVRPLPGAPVATPISWASLGKVEPQTFTVHHMAKGNPWVNFAKSAKSIASLCE